MEDTPNTSQYGKPLSNGGKLSNEIYDAEHGKYAEKPMPSPSTTLPVKHDPKPFNIKGT